MLTIRFVWVQFLDGTTLRGVMSINKQTRAAIAAETHIFTMDNPKFIHGDGEWGRAASFVVVAMWRMPYQSQFKSLYKFLPAACPRTGQANSLQSFRRELHLGGAGIKSLV